MLFLFEKLLWLFGKLWMVNKVKSKNNIIFFECQITIYYVKFFQPDSTLYSDFKIPANRTSNINISLNQIQ